MSFNGSGTYSLPSGNPVVSGTTISSTVMNSTLTDIATALSTTLTRDGQATATANIPMGSHKLTGLSAGSATGDSVRWEQLFSLGSTTDIASGATTDIGAVNSTILNVTGTTGITSFGANYNGPRFLRFAGALTLTHNASTLILPGAANITTAAGDACIVAPVGNSGSGWAVLAYQRAASAPGSATQLATARTLAITGDLSWTSPAFDGSANVTAAGTLATVNSNVGSFGSATTIPVVTVNGKGLVTAVTTATPQLLGVGQTYSGDIGPSGTGARAANVTYTNSTGKPIQLAIHASAAGSFLPLTIGGKVAGGWTSAQASTVNAIVPNGATYIVASGVTISVWTELS